MSRFPLQPTTPEPERALLVGVDLGTSAWPIERSLDELSRLAETAGAVEVARLTQRLSRPNPRTFIGSGKVQELVGFVNRLEVDVVIFDDDLSPSQQSNLEKAVGRDVKIIDRTALILDIFGLHATTREGRLQVQLAQLQYLLPRLRGMWSHLAKEQTRGGIGSRFGQGESQLEVDRRLVRKRISSIQRDLAEIEKRRGVQAKSRIASPAFRVALAGYTNAGKSSLLNALTGSEVLAQDKLFATLDPTTRAYRLPGGRMMTLTDTVGFIQKLPHGLVEAFRSTLSEVREADLILKVVDVSDPDASRQLDAVDHVLTEIGAGEIITLTVWNKIDLIAPDYLEVLKRRHPDEVFCSALSGEGLIDLTERIAQEAALSDLQVDVHSPSDQGAPLRIAHTYGQILLEEYEDTSIHLIARVPRSLSSYFEPYLRSV